MVELLKKAQTIKKVNQSEREATEINEMGIFRHFEPNQLSSYLVFIFLSPFYTCYFTSKLNNLLSPINASRWSSILTGPTPAGVPVYI